jgi:hypothetical protein
MSHMMLFNSYHRGFIGGITEKRGVYFERIASWREQWINRIRYPDAYSLLSTSMRCEMALQAA